MWCKQCSAWCQVITSLFIWVLLKKKKHSVWVLLFRADVQKLLSQFLWHLCSPKYTHRLNFYCYCSAAEKLLKRGVFAESRLVCDNTSTGTQALGTDSVNLVQVKSEAAFASERWKGIPVRLCFSLQFKIFSEQTIFAPFSLRQIFKSSYSTS